MSDMDFINLDDTVEHEFSANDMANIDSLDYTFDALENRQVNLVLGDLGFAHAASSIPDYDFSLAGPDQDFDFIGTIMDSPIGDIFSMAGSLLELPLNLVNGLSKSFFDFDLKTGQSISDDSTPEEKSSALIRHAEEERKKDGRSILDLKSWTARDYIAAIAMFGVLYDKKKGRDQAEEQYGDAKRFKEQEMSMKERELNMTMELARLKASIEQQRLDLDKERVAQNAPGGRISVSPAGENVLSRVRRNNSEE